MTRAACRSVPHRARLADAATRLMPRSGPCRNLYAIRRIPRRLVVGRRRLVCVLPQDRPSWLNLMTGTDALAGHSGKAPADEECEPLQREYSSSARPGGAGAA